VIPESKDKAHMEGPRQQHALCLLVAQVHSLGDNITTTPF
jgi:hypothetical protein